MTIDIESALTTTAQALQSVSDSPRLDAELLLVSVLDEPRSHLFAHPDEALSTEDAVRLSALVQRRLNHEPIAYLTGEKEFWSLPLMVSTATLVPRPETELLVEATLALIPRDASMAVLDLGTGSGAIAIAISSERPLCRIVATDLSSPALTIAAANAERHELTNITFLQGDWLEPVADRTFDLVVSNPPYVAENDAAMNLLRCEPRIALVAGEDGLDAIRRIAADAGKNLLGGGALLVEHGADQEEAVAQVLADEGWDNIQCLPDLSNLPRVTCALWKPNEEGQEPVGLRTHLLRQQATNRLWIK